MISSSFEKFSGIYCSGCYIKNQQTVTALSLLFEEVYIPNNLEVVIDLAHHNQFIGLPDNIVQEASSLELKPIEGQQGDDPICNLTSEQQMFVKQYLTVASHFFIKYHELIGSVIKSNIIKDNEVFSVKLVKKGAAGEKNTYSVSVNPMTVTYEENGDYFRSLISQGSIPILCDGSSNLLLSKVKHNNINSLELACLLAMKSIQLILPATKLVDSETILEARYKLRDLLPLFWSSMLKLSSELKKRISNNTSFDNMLFEGQEIINTSVLPALIELKKKMNKERKDWFHKILGPIASGVKLFIGNPQLTPEGLLRAGLSTGIDILDGFSAQMRAVDTLKREDGLGFLLKLDNIVVGTK